MPSERAKAAITSVPFLYKILLPAVRFLRRATRSTPQHKLQRFRRYCACVPNIAPDPLFVKVGANDGTTADPCSDILLADTRWKGLLIEPVPYCFARLSATFHDAQRFVLEQVAVGAPAGEATFYYVDPKAREILPTLPIWFEQLGSFAKSHIAKHLNGVLTPFIVECRVAVRPLSDVLKEHDIRDIHLLHIDTEGHDYEVLKTLDFEEYTPVAIFVEHKHLSDAQKRGMLHVLRMRGYSVHDCGDDYFALDKKAKRRLRWTAPERRR